MRTSDWARSWCRSFRLSRSGRWGHVKGTSGHEDQRAMGECGGKRVWEWVWVEWVVVVVEVAVVVDVESGCCS